MSNHCASFTKLSEFLEEIRIHFVYFVVWQHNLNICEILCSLANFSHLANIAWTWFVRHWYLEMDLNWKSINKICVSSTHQHIADWNNLSSVRLSRQGYKSRGANRRRLKCIIIFLSLYNKDICPYKVGLWLMTYHKYTWSYLFS